MDINKNNLLALEEVLKAAKNAEENNTLIPQRLADALAFIAETIKNGNECNYGNTVVGFFVREANNKEAKTSHR